MPPVQGRASETDAAFHAALHSGFPYDAGDDPALFSARRHRGPITWGVCRPDVRCSICKGDGIVFFAAQNDSQNETTRYSFVAALRVPDKMLHTALSTHPVFGQYLNLLIRPCGSGWEHYEPVAEQNHPDWLWRITCRSLVRSQGRLKKHYVVDTGKAHLPGKPLAFPVAANYVVFSTSSAVLADNPPVVATFSNGEAPESWKRDSTSDAIRKLVLRDSCRYLRTSNRHQPHRHIHHPHLEESDLEEMFRRLSDLIKKLAL